VRVTVDQHRCVSSGNCALALPRVFSQREDDGVVVLLDESPPGEELGDVLEVADMCPGRAIEVEQ
jgi:ferredoxin